MDHPVMRALLLAACLAPSIAGCQATQAMVPTVRLPALPEGAAASAGGGKAGAPLQVGVGRAIPATASVAATQRLLAWQHGPRASVAALRFVSEGAAGLRLGVLVHKLPVEAVIRGYRRAGGPVSFEVAGSAILQVLRANREAGDRTDAGRTWWTPPVEGAEVTLEIVLPPGISPSAVEVAVPTLSHTWR